MLVTFNKLTFIYEIVKIKLSSISQNKHSLTYRFNDFDRDRDHRAPPRGYSRDGYTDRPPRERSYERPPPTREPPRFEDRREDRDRRDRDRDDRLAPSDRYRYCFENPVNIYLSSKQKQIQRFSM